jgi:superfamily II DNA or RNA helicase
VTNYAVGSLIRARGREWVVLPESEDDLLVLRPLGGSDEDVAGVLPALELVESATFDDPDPRDLGDAASAGLLRSALRIGFRSSGGPFRSFAGLTVTPRSYQLVPLLMALKQETVRLLIADDVGIGKTVESLLIAAELIAQGEVRRMTVLCSPHLAEQWARAMREQFGLDAVAVLPSTVNRLERNLPFGESLFERYPITVVSTDFIKRARRRDDFIRACPEFVIVDEAHTCVDAGGPGSVRGRHQRYELLSRLSQDENRHLVLVTATPHSGKEDAFRRLLALMEPALGDLPADLTGEARRRDRERLARHLIQRRRADIRRYLDEDTPFPDRHSTEESYTLSEDYHKLFNRVLDYARETVNEGDELHQRVRWWSVLALLRSLASSPAAAAATLSNRARNSDAATLDEADDLGRASVLDMADDEAIEGIDTTPGALTAVDDTDAGVATSTRRRLLAMASEADALAGPADLKLTRAIAMVKKLVADGYNPILFCRFIPTADYVAAHLRQALPKTIAVASVTGELPPEEREKRIVDLAAEADKRVLVATDCLSEGVNLQEHFTAVVHYDLAWNPTRHEQREGRVDRFGQPKDTVRAVTYYGRDNRIDGIVLDVLLRKHNAIRTATGVSVPVPGDSNKVVEAVMEGVLLRRGEPIEQLTLDGVGEARRDELFEEWESAAEQEKRSRTLYAQEGIKPQEVAAELAQVRAALGDAEEAGLFIRDALTGLHAPLGAIPGGFQVHTAGLPPALRDGLPMADPLIFHETLPVPRGHALLARTDPAVEAIARYILDTALDPLVGDGPRPARRCGVIRPSAVAERTTLLLVRFRFHINLPTPAGIRKIVAEEARVVGLRGPRDDRQFIDETDVSRLLAAAPEANVPEDQASLQVSRVLVTLGELRAVLDDTADMLAGQLLESHRAVRQAADSRIRGLAVTAQKPVDILGLYVYLPIVGAGT